MASNSAKFIPLATKRNQLVFKQLVPGFKALIDVAQLDTPSMSYLVPAWIRAEERAFRPPAVWYKDGPDGLPVRCGLAERLRVPVGGDGSGFIVCD